MYPASDKISCKAANMSFICACLVALIHFPPFPRDGAVLDFMWNVFPGAVLRVAVPFFFVASGYWLAVRCDEKGWWVAALKSRAQSLMLPYSVLNILWFGFTVLYSRIILSSAEPISIRSMLVALGLVRGEYPALEHLWYVWRLGILVLISPICVFIAHKSKWMSYLVITMLIVCLAGRALYTRLAGDMYPAVIALFKYIIPPVGLAGFMTGVTFRIHGIPKVPKWLSAMLCCLGFSLLCICKAAENIFTSVLCFYAALFPFLLGAWGIVPEKHFPKWIVRNTFAIYVFHWIIFWFLQRLANAFRLNEFLGSVVGYFVCLAIGIMGGCLIGVLVHKSKLATKLLLGGR